MYSAERAARLFADPGPEFSASLWWGWDGPVDEAVISRDLDDILAMGIRCVTIEAGYGMKETYLSPGWFKLVAFAVKEAAKRGMRVWIVDEGKYPSGFAGGAFGRERPDLLMQALVVAQKIPADESAFSEPMPSQTVAAVLVNKETGKAATLEIRGSRILRPQSGFLPGDEIRLIGQERKSSETRAVSNPGRGKDTENPLCDYLDPRATKQFIAFTHEKYEKVLGREFGKTVMGFRGDEPDFAFMPWTDRLPDEFRKRKGYDVRPFLGLFFAPVPSPDVLRVMADYWDVWSGLFAKNFFKLQADWCGSRKLSYAVHLNHEDDMPALVKSEGDFFKCMRYVQVPGVDVIWNQVWPGKTADFPKLASSAAHINGRTRAFTESFAAYKPQPDLAQAKWVLDHQFVRGINMVELMFYPSSVAGSAPGTTAVREKWLDSPDFPLLAAYIHRASYLLSLGRPAASVALYYPTANLWQGDTDADAYVWKIAAGLLGAQQDFDFVDEAALVSTCRLKTDGFENKSGQKYRAVIIPPQAVLSKAALMRIDKFERGGGLVIRAGEMPGILEMLRLSVPADVSLDSPCPDIKVLHRVWKNADLYFFFNEGYSAQSRNMRLAGNGVLQVWDARHGKITVDGNTRSHDGRIIASLQLAPWESRFVIIG